MGNSDGAASPELLRFQQQVRDALELLTFAIASGRNVSSSVISSLTKAENYLKDSPWPGDAERAEFEEAYRDLAVFMKPVTIATVRATTDSPNLSGSSWTRFWKRVTFRTNSPAKRYSKMFWQLVILCTVLITASEIIIDIDSVSKSAGSLKPIAKALLPFLYGWLGALAYLLRSAHSYIADSTFDPKRVPEYFNRMLLGAISGALVLMFGEFVDKEALASFIVGYNTDYLFQMLERTANSIFPKDKDKGDQAAKPGIGSVAIETASKQLAPGTSGNASVTLNAPAPAGGSAIQLSAAEALKIQPSLAVSQGKTSASFAFTVASNAQEGPAIITATGPDGSTANAVVQIKKAAA